ncbi:MAG: hypothetical protein K2L07_07150 [Lachnospiraceae bacterium]|nr:hypothetical protein [Lachnospiraceae bacterium]
MNRRTVLSMVVILNIILTGCGELYSDVEEPINYISWLEGEWQIKNVMTWGGAPVNEGWDIVKSYVGIRYDFTKPLGGELSGGVVPIRDIELQPFFHGEGYLFELGLTGNYYTMFWIDTEEWEGTNTCFVIKNKDEWLVWKNCDGVYRLQRMDSAKEQVHVYDAKVSFEENIRMRMQEQGIRSHGYFSNVWGGNWTIKEVIYTEDMSEAQTHLGETVFYHNSGVDYFDINFIASSEDRVFYRMPTTGELGLEGTYYLLIWDEDSDYPAAIVASEHEIFLIQGNTMFRAVQEEEYLDEAALQGL